MLRNLASMTTLALVGLFAVAALAPVWAATPKIVAGTLTCNGKGTVGLILGSKESLSCRYQPANGARSQFYAGTITKLGLDVGVSGPSVIIWSVLGSTTELSYGALQGNYGGLSAQASVAVGVGANALVGGSSRSIVLQPLSVKAQQGVNLAVGVAELNLRPRRLRIGN